MNLQKAFWISAVSLLFYAQPPLAKALETESDWNNFTKKYLVRNVFQVGPEFDSNVFKTFDQGDKDGLVRLLFKSSGRTALTSSAFLGWRYQGGGKVFFRRSEQNTLIQYLQAPFFWNASSWFSLGFSPDIKYQNENSAIDDWRPIPLDVNEDYLSTKSRLNLRFRLPGSLHFDPYASFTYFNFDALPDFSFHREQGGVIIRRTFIDQLLLGAEYSFSAQSFFNTTREDQLHEFSGFVQWMGTPFFSGRYTYQDNSSKDSSGTDGLYSFTNHRISLLLSFPFLERDSSSTKDSEEAPLALFAFSVLGNLQLRDFPEVFDFTGEGQRFLLTGEEDDNFNSVIVKLTYHPLKLLAVEGKFTRYSNELTEASDQFDAKFSRNLFYSGVRLTF